MKIKAKYLDKFIKHKKGDNPKLKEIFKKAKEVEKNVTSKDFTENAALYAIKLKMTGYSI